MNRTGLFVAGALIIAALGFMAWLHNSIAAQPENYRFGGRPVVEFGGRITDARDGTGLEGVFVIVDMTSYSAVPFVGHGASGCNYGSGVVRTNAEGHYRYRWDWKANGEEIPRDLSIKLRIYKPGWEFHPLIRGGMQWESVTRQRDFEMVPSTETLAERLENFTMIRDNNCSQGVNEGRFGWPELYDAMSREVWGMYCQPDGIGYDDLSYPSFMATMWESMGVATRRNRMREPKPSEYDHFQYIHMVKKLIQSELPEFPWKEQTDPVPARDFTREEKTALCARMASESLLKELGL